MLAEAPVLTGGEGSINPYSIWSRDKFTPILDGDLIETEGATLQAIFTPGHANDHVSLFLREERALFTGDNVLGVGTSVFNDLDAYIKSLERMRATNPTRLYPAHGPIVDQAAAPALIDDYIRHRMARVNQIEDAMGQRAVGTDWTAEEITRVIYTEIPENLIPAATNNTVLVLRKLHAEGKVAFDTKGGGTSWQLSVAAVSNKMLV